MFRTIILSLGIFISVIGISSAQQKIQPKPSPYAPRQVFGSPPPPDATWNPKPTAINKQFAQKNWMNKIYNYLNSQLSTSGWVDKEFWIPAQEIEALQESYEKEDWNVNIKQVALKDDDAPIHRANIYRIRINLVVGPND